MEKNLDLIIQAISERMEWEGYECFYIGKTDNIERRRNEHREEGLNETFELVKGKPETISKYEIALIKKCKNIPGIKNKEVCSNGNDDASILYVSFKHVFSETSRLFDDTIALKKGLPINLEDKGE